MGTLVLLKGKLLLGVSVHWCINIYTHPLHMDETLLRGGDISVASQNANSYNVHDEATQGFLHVRVYIHTYIHMHVLFGFFCQ